MDQQLAQDKARAIIRMSQQKYGLPKAEVETLINISLGQAKSVPQPQQTSDKAEPNKDEEISKEILKKSGRGGDRHKQLQSDIKTIAEKLGFKATIEKRINNGKGHVDVALEQGNLRIAVEVAVNSTVEQERHNIEKCLKAAFDIVYAISPDQELLSQLKSKVQSHHQVKFLLPIQLEKELQQFDHSSNKRLFGYEVDIQYPNKNQNDVQKIKQTIYEVIAKDE